MRSIDTSALGTITQSFTALNPHEIRNWDRALGECYFIRDSYSGQLKNVKPVLFKQFSEAKTLWDTSIFSSVSNIGMYSMLSHQIVYHYPLYLKRNEALNANQLFIYPLREYLR